MGSVGRRRDPGRLEGEVLHLLWQSDSAMTPAEVRERLAHDLAYTTVMTVLGRLLEKGLLERTQRGRAFEYRAVMGEAELVARKMHQALGSAIDPGLTVSRFVSELNAEERRALEAALRDLR